jgi:hypothetical protein
LQHIFGHGIRNDVGNDKKRWSAGDRKQEALANHLFQEGLIMLGDNAVAKSVAIRTLGIDDHIAYSLRHSTHVTVYQRAAHMNEVRKATRTNDSGRNSP